MASWLITFEGQVYREDDLTLDEAVAIEEATGRTWYAINPVRSAAMGRAVLETLLASRTGIDQAAARAKVGKLRAIEFLELVSEEDDDADLPTQFEDGFPQPADGPSTPS